MVGKVVEVVVVGGAEDDEEVVVGVVVGVVVVVVAVVVVEVDTTDRVAAASVKNVSTSITVNCQTSNKLRQC